MRFSHTLRFNANPAWWQFYMPYEDLKRKVDKLAHLKTIIRSYPQSNELPPPVPRRQVARPRDDSSDDEPETKMSSQYGAVSPARPAPNDAEPLLRRTTSERVMQHLDEMDFNLETDTDVFEVDKYVRQPTPALGGTYGAVTGFDSDVEEYHPSFASKSDAMKAFSRLEISFFKKLNSSAVNTHRFFVSLCTELSKTNSKLLKIAAIEGDPDYEEDQRHPLLFPDEERAYIPLSDTQRAALKTHICTQYRDVAEALTFGSMNRSGFEKILKKHDKVTGAKTQQVFMNQLDNRCRWQDTAQLDHLQHEMVRLYSELYTNDRTDVAAKQLKDHLRDLVFWERNTVWRNALRAERRVATFRTAKPGVNIEDVESEAKESLNIPWRSLLITLLCAIAASFIPLRRIAVQHYPDQVLGAARRCLSLLAFVVILWGTQAIPLFATSFIAFIGCVVFRVLLDEKGVPLSPADASQVVLQRADSSTLLLIICVYSLGAALTKFEIDRYFAVKVISKMRSARMLLIAVMTMSVFVSSVVSNVASPVLLNQVVSPVIGHMSTETDKNRRYIKCLLFGIMVSSNVGGFVSPVASPQSAVALSLLRGANKVSFLQWIVVALPICTIIVAAFGWALSRHYEPSSFSLPNTAFGKVHFDERSSWVVGILAMTILMWVIHPVTELFGSAGMAGCVPIVLLFSIGLLNKEDFNSLPWDVVYLVAGGTVIGAGVESCKLLEILAGRISQLVATIGMFGSALLLCLVMTVVANVVSHTISAIIILPLCLKIGVSLGHPRLLVLLCTFAASCAMTLTISSFPNMSAQRVEDHYGKSFISPAELARVGVVMNLIALSILLTVGFLYMYIIL